MEKLHSNQKVSCINKGCAFRHRSLVAFMLYPVPREGKLPRIERCALASPSASSKLIIIITTETVDTYNILKV